MAINWAEAASMWAVPTYAAYKGYQWANDPNARQHDGQQIYDITGFDPLGSQPAPDWHGEGIQRGEATELGDAGQARYTAAQEELGRKFAQARTRSLQGSQSRGLQTSGMAAKQEQDLYTEQAAAEGQVYAQLMQEEQAFLDKQYMYDKQLAFKVTQMEQQEKLARQQMTMDFIGEIVGAGFDLATLGVA